MIDPRPLDITNSPELRHLVEEVRNSKQPRLLKQNSEPVAMLMPLGTTIKRQSSGTQENIWDHYNPQQVRKALEKSAGTLKEVDRKRLLTDLRNARSQEQPVRPF